MSEKTTDEILALYKSRVATYGNLHAKMREVQAIYSGAARVPLPEVERNEIASVPNLMAQGIDQMSGRIASVVPNIQFTPKKNNVRKEQRRASTAGRIIQGYWQSDRISMKLKNRARQMIAYGMSPVVIRWDDTHHRPTWHIRHPLETFPSVDIQPGQTQPRDCIFAYRRTVGWLKMHGYGAHLTKLVGFESMLTEDTPMLLLEYIDKDCTMLVLTAFADPTYPDPVTGAIDGKRRAVTLEYFKNPLDTPLVHIPMRITLDGPQGQFDNMIGMYYQQAKLMALETIAVEKGIFPDTYLVSRPGEVGRFLDGPHDGRTGMVNIISGGDIREVQSQPGYLTNPTIDRLERAQRVTAGIPQEFGGESATNIRTGRRGENVLSAAIDFPVAEAQETFAYTLMSEDITAIKLAKALDGDNERTIYVGTGNQTHSVTYKANQVFPHEEHVVSYPATGADVNQLIVGLGQRIGLGIMSKETAADLDPFVNNPEGEKDQIVAEGLQQALMAGVQQQAASGQMPPATVAKLISMVGSDQMELAEAMTAVAAEALEAQRESQEMEDEEMSLDQAMAPANLAAMTGPQGPQSMPATQGPSPDQQNMMQMLSTMRRPQTATGGV
jgi:hypothetical protein